MLRKEITTHNSSTFFSYELKKLKSIIDGKFNYNEAFKSFTNATNQKKETALIIGEFIEKLLETRELSFNKESMKIADLGCANSSTCLGYLKNTSSNLEFDYIGFDINKTFLEEAKKILPHEPIIKKFTLINDDALSGNLQYRSDIKPHSFDIIFASHIAYYIKDEASGRLFLKDILNLLSKNTGISIFLHEDSTHYFRSTYNRKYNKLSVPELLNRCALNLIENSNQLSSVRFTSKLNFSELTEELWEATKDPKYYRKYAYIPNFTNTLNKLAFIVQCDLSTLAEEGSLSSYINDIRELLQQNDNCLVLTTNMQTLVSPQYAHTQNLNLILNDLEEKIPSILGQKVIFDLHGTSMLF